MVPAPQTTGANGNLTSWTIETSCSWYLSLFLLHLPESFPYIGYGESWDYKVQTEQVEKSWWLPTTNGTRLGRLIATSKHLNMALANNVNNCRVGNLLFQTFALFALSIFGSSLFRSRRSLQKIDRINLLSSLFTKELPWANRSFALTLTKNELFAQKTEEPIPSPDTERELV